jgi:hypothetical protein
MLIDLVPNPARRIRPGERPALLAADEDTPRRGSDELPTMGFMDAEQSPLGSAPNQLRVHSTPAATPARESTR